jgi:hypothetical protein
MHRIWRTFALSLALLAISAASAGAQESVAGRWIFTITYAEIGEMSMAMEFEQDGAEVTGIADLAAIPDVEDSEVSDGLYEDGVLSFLLHVSAQGQWFTAKVEADVDGDAMVGEVYMAEMGQAAPFTAKRAEN